LNHQLRIDQGVDLAVKPGAFVLVKILVRFQKASQGPPYVARRKLLETISLNSPPGCKSLIDLPMH
jgi:hypothetical protein